MIGSSWSRTHLLPNSIVSRMGAVLFAGILVAQILSTWLWLEQIKTSEFNRLVQVSENMGARIGQTIKFFNQLPSHYRHIVLDQLRDMGGTRFFVSVNKQYIDLQEINDSELSRLLQARLESTIIAQAGELNNISVEFVAFDNLKILSGNNYMVDLPPKWKRFALIQPGDLSPVVVVQLELDREWMYLAAPIPEGSALLGFNWLTEERIISLGLVSLTVLILTLMLVRWVVQPLKLLARRVDVFGKGGSFEYLQEQGSSEMIATIRAFNSMAQRIQKFISEREQLFSSISHDLKTPLTRARLRIEMLDELKIKKDLITDLDNLDTMIKGSLQMMKDNVIHENTEQINLRKLLENLLAKENVRGLPIERKIADNMVIEGRPMALERLFANLIENAFKYSKSVEVDGRLVDSTIYVKIMDRGPGLSDADKVMAFQPYNRLNKQPNESNVGLGLSIARSIAKLHGGELNLIDRPGGGLIAEIKFPL